MSTDLQLKGDSRRRQLESSTAYAAAHGLDLVDDAQLEDIGISAFKGANIKEGALGRFLDAAKAGKIERGSFLLVESLDRLSRQEVRKSLAIFLNIIDAGINIVTLADNRTYTADNTQEIDLITSLVIMSRAHEESRTKSQRVGAAWANKRAQAQTRPLTKWCPAWLRLSDDRKNYEIIEGRAAIVRTIFEDTVAGIGNYSITRRLNERKVPHFGKSRGWHSSYIAKILNSRAVIGEFQPHRLVDGKRSPEGGPIKNYFPSIIDEQLFFRAQLSRTERLRRGAGRKGAFISNLFSSLATCAYCHSPMKFENKGAPPKGAAFLVCDNAIRGLGCSIARWRYDQFEASFLAFVQELDLEALVRSENETKKRGEFDDEIASLRGELISIEQQRDRTFELFAKAGGASDYVAQKLEELQQRHTTLDTALKQKESARLALNSDLTGFYESKEQIKTLIEKLQKPGDEVYKLRSQIASKLKSLILTLTVAPLGDIPRLRRSIEFLRNDKSEADKTELMGHMTEMLKDDRQKRRYFAIYFKDKTIRAVFPNVNDPLLFDEQVFECARR